MKHTLKTAARGLLDIASFADGLITAAKLDLTGAFDLSGGSLTVATPTNAGHAATKAYVDALIQGLTPKGSVRFVLELTDLTDGPGLTYNGGAKTLTSNTNFDLNSGALDSITNFAVGERILVQLTSSDQSSAGIYDITDLGSAGTPFVLTRSSNFDASADIKAGSFVIVEDGASAGKFAYLTTEGPYTLDTTALDWLVTSGGTSYSAGNGLNLTSTTFSVAPKSGGVVVVDGSGVDVQASSGSQAGTMSSTDFTKLSRYPGVLLSDHGTPPTTTDTGTYDFTLSALGANACKRVIVDFMARSNDDATKVISRQVQFTVRRGGSGDSVLVEDIDEISAVADTGGIEGVTVSVVVSGGNGTDIVRFTGVNSHTIKYSIMATERVLS